MSFWRKSPFYRCRSDPNAIIFVQDDIINIFLFFPIGHKSTQSMAINRLNLSQSKLLVSKFRAFIVWNTNFIAFGRKFTKWCDIMVQMKEVLLMMWLITLNKFLRPATVSFAKMLRDLLLKSEGVKMNNVHQYFLC